MSFTITRASDFDDDVVLYKDTESGVEKFLPKTMAQMKALLDIDDNADNISALETKTAQIATNGQSATVTGNLVGANVLATNETRLAALEVQITTWAFVKGNTTERTALALTLDTDDEGLVEFWDTTLKAKFLWNGTEFV